MEILKRAKGDAGEGIPWNADPKALREEINSRTCKAGYTNSDGTPRGAGKGDSPRPVDKQKYDEGYERIFGHG